MCVHVSVCIHVYIYIYIFLLIMYFSLFMYVYVCVCVFSCLAVLLPHPEARLLDRAEEIRTSEASGRSEA